ncbi:MAG: SDR family NAD(P)-dependent oxidoreductase [Burkholderiales bacterium]|nr:SDR family NAD(P)-dependent oxidoreductase [Burkholderiales bacterium]
MSKTVLITGAGSGFGRDAAVQLAGRGHVVIATVESAQQAAALSAAHPELTVAKLDITDAGDVATVDRWDLDVFIANAGRGQTGPLAVLPLARLRAVFEVNVFGTFAVTQRVAAAMKRRRSGRILIVSSIAGVRAGIGSGPYAMTKHALQAMGGVLRNELAPFGIDVALINPGPYATGFNDRMAKDPGDWFDRATAAPEDVAIMDSLVQRITVGQLDPAEVVKRYVELVEADKTELINFIPEDIVERLSRPRPG